MDGTGDHDCAFPNSTVGNCLPAPSSPFFPPPCYGGLGLWETVKVWKSRYLIASRKDDGAANLTYTAHT